MPVKIVIEHLAGARIGQRQVLEPAARVRFGRHPDNEVAFDTHKDLDASARHAELRREGDGYVLVDVGSSNGTFVDGVKLQRHEVRPGVPALVEFGRGGPRLRLTIGDPRQIGAVPETLVRSGAPAPRRSVAMMVQHASLEAQGQAGVARSTLFMKSMVDQALHHSTRRFRLFFVGITLVLASAIVGLVVWNLALTKSARSTSPPPPPPAPDQSEIGSRIARAAHDAAYLLAAEHGGDNRPFCTAFAVAPTTLVTNAHCVDVINRLRGEGAAPFAVQNGRGEVRLALAWVKRHPDYIAGAPRQTVDVALVELAEPAHAPALLALADRKRLESLEVGAQVFVYGFPDRLAKVTAPEATLTQGTVGRLTGLDERRGAFGENLLVQHSAFTMEGTSGSPVFDKTGLVVAVNTGAYARIAGGSGAEPSAEGGSGGSGGVNLAPSQALSGYNIAIRIDTVAQLLTDTGVSSGGQSSP
jgi:hypothetical protein